MSTDAAGGVGVSLAVADAIAALPLIDHHVHGTLRGPVTRTTFETLITESDRPTPTWSTQFDSQIGFAIRRHCGPLLGLPPLVSDEEYWAARERQEPEDLARAFLAASGTSDWLVETGYKGEEIASPAELASYAVGRTHEIVRLESVLESVVAGANAADLFNRFTDALADRAGDAVGLKSIVAYRHGFDFDPERPDSSDIVRAADRWLREMDAGAAPRVADPVLLRMLLWAGVDTGLPLQLHAGYGDPDVELHRCDPLLLTRWIRAIEGSGTDLMLLHCYPFHRNAGYLAQVFPHVYFDVGLAINYTGAASVRIIAETLELAPFTKVLYSSDAWGAPELHYLGATLWRQGMNAVLGGFVAHGEWSVQDAVRVATVIGSDNARRVYGLVP